ncbi:MAG: hypothetical protein GYB64_04015 [Chloroflexi bacterium]|nr:hypothetical protein [Chloroflexota bacterium]
MAYTLTTYPDDAMMVFEWGDHMRPEDTIEANAAVKAFAQEVEGDFVPVHEVSRIRITFSDLVQTLAAGLRMERGITLADRHIIAVVGTGGLVNLGVQALAQRQYGGFRVWSFDTLDEAMEAARAHHHEDSVDDHP